MSSRKAIADAAASHLDALDRDLVARGGLRLGASTGDLTLVAALRALLIQRAADATSASVVPSPSLARVALHRVSSRARGRLRTILRSTPGSTPAARRRVVLMVPREPHHLRDMVPVADQLATRDVRVVWLVFTDDAHDRLRAEGHQVMHAEGLGQPRATEVVRLSQEVLRWSRDRGIEDPVVRAVHEAIVALAPRAVDPLLVSADAVRRIVETLNPALVVVGNATTPDGVVALATARVAGIPTATLQHGTIVANQDGWRRAGVDLFTVWGPGVRDELVGQGVAASTIAVTGAPWVDRLVTRPASRSRTILVALSGPGHAVGLAEHEGQVEALARACAVTPHYKWVFRLHRKDDAAIYHRAFAAHPDARPEIVPSQRATGTIHDALEDTAVLITVTSASALDAMLCGVPVLTLGRPPHESLPDFVRVGATSHVSDLGGLGVALTALVEQGPSPTLRDAAKAYVEASFGELDGQAAARVAAQMVSLVESLKKNTLQG